MSRGFRVLVVASILFVSVAVAAMLIWQGEVHRDAPVFGLVTLVFGAAVTTLHLTLGDDFLRRHFGEPGAAKLRPYWRSGWIPMLLGAALIGLHYLDRWVTATAAEEVQFNRGLSAAKAQDWQTAADAFSEAIRLNPSSAKAYHERGVALGFQGEHDRAIDDFSEAIRLDPNHAYARYHRGVAYFKKKDYDSAMTDFGEAIRLNPTFAKAYRARSSVYAKKGDQAGAKADKQKAAELEKSGEENP